MILLTEDCPESRYQARPRNVASPGTLPNNRLTLGFTRQPRWGHRSSQRYQPAVGTGATHVPLSQSRLRFARETTSIVHQVRFCSRGGSTTSNRSITPATFRVGSSPWDGRSLNFGLFSDHGYSHVGARRLSAAASSTAVNTDNILRGSQPRAVAFSSPGREGMSAGP